MQENFACVIVLYVYLLLHSYSSHPLMNRIVTVFHQYFIDKYFIDYHLHLYHVTDNMKLLHWPVMAELLTVAYLEI